MAGFTRKLDGTGQETVMVATFRDKLPLGDGEKGMAGGRGGGRDWLEENAVSADWALRGDVPSRRQCHA